MSATASPALATLGLRRCVATDLSEPERVAVLHEDPPAGSVFVRPDVVVGVFGDFRLAVGALSLGALCGFAVLVLSAPARAILSRSGLGAAYGPREASLEYFFDGLSETLVGAFFDVSNEL